MKNVAQIVQILAQLQGVRVRFNSLFSAQGQIIILADGIFRPFI
jgi:hypothetical protein